MFVIPCDAEAFSLEASRCRIDTASSATLETSSEAAIESAVATGLNSDSSSLDGRFTPSPPLPSPPLQFLSRGSALHASGKCRPCGWFWKPEGCKNGRDCGHCHLCSAGEVKARRKAKLAAMRSILAAEQPHSSIAPKPVSLCLSHLLPVQLSMQAGAASARALPPRLLPSPPPEPPCIMLLSEDISQPPSPPTSLPSRPFEVHENLLVLATVPKASTQLVDVTSSLAGLSCASQRESSPMERAEAAKQLVGSGKHGSRSCTPCAWFFKQQGCKNGKECSYCHLCPEGEIRSRRKAKNAALRGNLLAEPGTVQQHSSQSSIA